MCEEAHPVACTARSPPRTLSAQPLCKGCKYELLVHLSLSLSLQRERERERASHASTLAAAVKGQKMFLSAPPLPDKINTGPEGRQSAGAHLSQKCQEPGLHQRPRGCASTRADWMRSELQHCMGTDSSSAGGSLRGRSVRSRRNKGGSPGDARGPSTSPCAVLSSCERSCVVRMLGHRGFM